jgi:putative acetyltransferase
MVPELADPPALGRGSTVRFLARRHGTAVGIVSIAVDDGSAELKRMFVRPVARGHGVADALLDAALSRAAAAGCRTVWLETMRGAMDRAIAVYRRHGFVDSSRRGTLDGVPGVVVLERALGPRGGGRARAG